MVKSDLDPFFYLIEISTPSLILTDSPQCYFILPDVPTQPSPLHPLIKNHRLFGTQEYSSYSWNWNVVHVEKFRKKIHHSKIQDMENPKTILLC